MTMRTPNAELRPNDTLDISVADAARLSLGNDERVRVRSRYGEVLAADQNQCGGETRRTLRHFSYAGSFSEQA